MRKDKTIRHLDEAILKYGSKKNFIKVLKNSKNGMENALGLGMERSEKIMRPIKLLNEKLKKELGW